MKKRVLSLIMAVALAVTLAPTAMAQAADTPLDKKIGNWEYQSNTVKSGNDATGTIVTKKASDAGVNLDAGISKVVGNAEFMYIDVEAAKVHESLVPYVLELQTVANDVITGTIMSESTGDAKFVDGDFYDVSVAKGDLKIYADQQTAEVTTHSPAFFPVRITTPGQVLIKFVSQKLGRANPLYAVINCDANRAEDFKVIASDVNAGAKVENNSIFVQAGNERSLFELEPIAGSKFAAGAYTTEPIEYYSNVLGDKSAPVVATAPVIAAARKTDNRLLLTVAKNAAKNVTPTGMYIYEVRKDGVAIGEFAVYVGGITTIAYPDNAEIVTKRVAGSVVEDTVDFLDKTAVATGYLADGTTVTISGMGSDFEATFQARANTSFVGDKIRLPKLVRDGYDFEGWVAVSKDGGNLVESKEIIKAGNVVTVTGNVVYKAVWVGEYFTINYYHNDGTGAVTQRAVVVESLKTDSFDNEVLICDAYDLGIYYPGHEFVTWYLDAAGKNPVGGIAGDDAKHTLGQLQEYGKNRSEINLYANWKQGDVSVTYDWRAVDENGDKLIEKQIVVRNKVDTEYVRLNDKIALPGKEDSPVPGYYIAGWSLDVTEAERDHYDFDPGRIIDQTVLNEAAAKYGIVDTADAAGTNIQEITLYPVYAPKTYTLNFLNSNGVGSMAAQTRVYDKNLALPGCEYTRNGYYCAGYSINGYWIDTQNRDRSDLEYIDDMIWDAVGGFKDGATIDVQVEWERCRYAVTFLNDDGSVFVQSGTNSGTLYSPTVTPKKAGYNFVAWVDGNGNKYGVDAEIKNITYNTVLTPEFAEATYAITYDVKVDGNYNKGSYKISDLPLALPTPVDNLGEFMYWVDADKNVLKDGQLPEGTYGNQKLTAVWKPYATGVKLTPGVQKSFDYSTPQIVVEREIESHIIITDVKNGNGVGTPYDDSIADVEYKYSTAWEVTPARGSSQKVNVTAIVKLDPEDYCNANELPIAQRTLEVPDVVISGANATQLPGIVNIQDFERQFEANVSLGTVLGALESINMVQVTDENGKTYTTPISFVGRTNIGSTFNDDKVHSDTNEHAVYNNDIAQQVIDAFQAGKKVINVDSCVLWDYAGRVYYSNDYNTSRLTIYIGVKPVTPGAVEVVEQLDPELDNPVNGGIYRVFNPKTGEHIYTADYNEYSLLVKKYGWTNEHLRYISAKGSEAIQVMRLFNPETGEHIYTIDDNERKVLTTKYGWVLDDSTFKVYAKDSVEGQIEVNRVFNPNAETAVSSHVYTSDDNEVKVLTSKYGWDDEGVAFKLDLPK